MVDHWLRQGRITFITEVGCPVNIPMLTMLCRDYLSYDEGKISALLGASTKTVNINRGDRMNGGVVSREDDFEKSGVIVGLVGPRMNKNGVMESQVTLMSSV